MKTSRQKQQGFTLIELMVLLALISGLAICGGIAYVGLHFLHKFW